MYAHHVQLYLINQKQNQKYILNRHGRYPMPSCLKHIENLLDDVFGAKFRKD